jgi:tetrapyrrole methylase family protein/MazG family protein
MGRQLHRLIKIIARLRGPKGCPWDRRQTHRSLLSCLLDETYEFFEAAEDDDSEKMCEELGDLLLQVVLHAQIAAEKKTFTIEDAAAGICDKLVRRHPHVFGTATAVTTDEVLHNWEKIKKEEKRHSRKYIVDDIPAAMPALFRAEKMQRRVARVGFDWKDPRPAFGKVVEEFGEFRRALASRSRKEAAEELGDILFAIVNVARHHGICAEDALRAATRKFARRFRYIEDRFAEQGKELRGAALRQMDRYWEESKRARRKPAKRRSA